MPPLTPREIEGDPDSGPNMVTDSSGTYVPQNEDMVYADPEWEWLEASQLIEEGQ